MGSWEDALRDADEAVRLDPSCYRGYERRHAAGKYTKAFNAFRVMLAKLEKSPDKDVCKLRENYFDITSTIQQAIDETIINIPRVLIDTATGCLYGKSEQAAAFKSLPIYNKLRSSLTTPDSLKDPRILEEVKRFYKYVMLSHRWEEQGEPSYQMVRDVTVYELEPSSPATKLLKFCKVARTLGFHWAWSDTCCIDKKDNVILNESLVAMFTWYRGSALTLVHLHGVRSQSQKSGDLGQSEWNKRGWTYQEYVAAETVRFYTEDWKPYLGLDMCNHKESSIIVEEMEQASQVSAAQLLALQPGLDRVREKLYLASQRQTTLIEDCAYSLLGIFKANIFIRYGEGKCTAVGRLLEDILVRSRDITILAWVGPVGDYDSCLPPDLTVYNQVVPSHIPRLMNITEMDDIVIALRSSFSESDLTFIIQLYHLLDRLPLSSINSGCLKLPGVIFSVTNMKLVEPNSDTGCRVYCATTSLLGDVEIKTKDNLPEMEDLSLIHPWISILLDQDFSRRRGMADRPDDTTRALRLLARLWQPFGALLLARVTRMQYRRVATDGLIITRIPENTSLTKLMEGVTTVDVR